MACIGEQQDLFFEFDFNQTESNESFIADILQCRNDTFLIGCFRNDQKKQIDWILEKLTRDSVGKYNVRIGKGRNGWVNKDNPRISNPQYALLYEFENEEVVYGFKVNGSRVYSENDMVKKGYDTPKGDYLVYHLVRKCSICGVDVKKLLSEYRTHTNWVDGKPIYLTGSEILSTMRPKTKRKNKKVVEGYIFNKDLPDFKEVIRTINHNPKSDRTELVSFDLFSGCGGLTKGFAMAGIQSVFASDIDENCEKTFCCNFPGVPFLCKDITQITKDEVDALTKGRIPDVIIGGPPCQGFSLANK
jgi:hypothetical protein